MIAVVLLRLLYLIFEQMLGLLLLIRRTSSVKDVELLVLRLSSESYKWPVSRAKPRPARQRIERSSVL
jgi:hypothetical protein